MVGPRQTRATGVADRAMMVWLWERGTPPTVIARDINTSLTTVYRWIRRWRQDGSVRNKQRRTKCKKDIQKYAPIESIEEEQKAYGPSESNSGSFTTLYPPQHSYFLHNDLSLAGTWQKPHQYYKPFPVPCSSYCGYGANEGITDKNINTFQFSSSWIENTSTTAHSLSMNIK